MPAKRKFSFPTGLLLLALAGAATLLGYLLLAPAAPEPAGEIPDAVGLGGAGGGSLEFEFYDRLQQGDVEVGSRPGEPADPGATEVGRLIEQLTPAEPSAAQTQVEIAAGALEDIAQTIVSGIETRGPAAVSAPEPAPAAPVEPLSPAETTLGAPEPSPEPAPEPTPESSATGAEPAPAPAAPRNSTPAPAPIPTRPAAAEPEPAPASPPPAPATGAAGQTGTLLQSGAFRQRELAQSELERQRGLGLEVEISERAGREGALFVLQAGPFAASDKLEEAELVFRLHNIDTLRRSLP